MNDARWYQVRYFYTSVSKYGTESEEVYSAREYIKAYDMDEVIDYILGTFDPEYRDSFVEVNSDVDFVEYESEDPVNIFDENGEKVDLEKFDMDMDEALEKGYSFMYGGFEVTEMEKDFEPPEWWRPLTDLTKTGSVEKKGDVKMKGMSRKLSQREPKWYLVKFFFEEESKHRRGGNYYKIIKVKAYDLHDVVDYVLKNEVDPEYRDLMDENPDYEGVIGYKTIVPIAIENENGEEIDTHTLRMSFDEAFEEGYTLIYEGFDILELPYKEQLMKWYQYDSVDLTKTENVRGYSVRKSTIVKTESKKPMPKKVIKPCDCD